jgi:glycosyltransferase involved in cell wall biosynthesis
MISIIIPCHNSEGFLPRAVDSVLAQSYTDWELILVNNNSTDGTAALMDQYAAAHSDKIIATVETKKGAPAARNRGLQSAKGDWIQFLDADDELFPDKLERQMNLVKMAKPRPSVVAGTYYRVVVAQNDRKKLNKPIIHDVWRGLIRTRLGITSSNLWNAQALREVGGWDETLTSSQEYDLLFRLLAMGASVQSDLVPSCYIHMQEQSISAGTDNSSRERVVDNYIGLRCRIADYLKKKDMMTSELKRDYDSWLYSYLIGEKRHVPDYAKRMLSKLNLKVPLSTYFYANIKFQVARLLGRW